MSHPRLSPVVRAGLGMNQDAEQFRRVLLEADFQFGLDVVHARQRKIIRQTCNGTRRTCGRARA